MRQDIIGTEPQPEGRPVWCPTDAVTPTAPIHTARLAGQTIEYIHVSSVDQARGRLPVGAMVLQDVRTRGGTRELLVEENDDLFILAEKVA